MKRLDLDILLQEGEGAMLEYKESLSASFARELVALANTAGGKILLGVRDDRTVKGIPDSNDLRARIQDIARNCDQTVKVLVQRLGEVTVVTVRENAGSDSLAAKRELCLIHSRTCCRNGEIRKRRGTSHSQTSSGGTFAAHRSGQGWVLGNH